MPPAENNAIFDSKVLSRNHAEIYLDNGRVRPTPGAEPAGTGARKAENAGPLKDPGVGGARSARGHEPDVQIYLKDLGSSNGTFMNGASVKGAQLLDDGDTIDFGVDVTDEETERA